MSHMAFYKTLDFWVLEGRASRLTFAMNRMLG